MIAVDTNVVIRFLADDEAVQSRRARALFEHERIFLLKTVLLEAEWVLRRLFGFDRAAVLDALERLVALPSVTCEDAAAVADALRWATSDGVDFADALHCASARPAGEFASFDRKLVGRVRDLAGFTVRML